MKSSIKIVALSGSIRSGSNSSKLINAFRLEAEKNEVNVKIVDLSQYELPIYNEDLETQGGLQENAKLLKSIVTEADAIVIATPEYNGHVPPLLVNTFCWLSRAENNEAPCDVFNGKVAAILASSPGGFGGIRVIPRLKDMLTELGCTLLSNSISVPAAHEAFLESGELKSEETTKRIHALLKALQALAPLS